MKNRFYRLKFLGRHERFLEYKAAGGGSYSLGGPVFELNQKVVKVALAGLKQVGKLTLSNGAVEHLWQADVTGQPGVSLRAAFRISPDSPVLRYRYSLFGPTSLKLTKQSGQDQLRFASMDLPAGARATEVRFSEFLEQVHSYCLNEIPLKENQFEDSQKMMGPILAAETGKASLLMAYEHGSTVPDTFVTFALAPGGKIKLQAVKGTYHDGQSLDKEQGYQTLWLQFAAVKGGLDSLAAHYRRFVLKYQSLNQESRKPYLFYNTWNYQERNHTWNKKPYLESMQQEHILAEIDVAHRMGVDVYVIDTGWYGKTGDWQVNLERFPDGLKAVRKRLEGYGMKMGLWFAPPSAAETSRMMAGHRDCRMTWKGKGQKPSKVWETEEASGLCLASRFWKSFADELIRLNRELGVNYFKWDAVSQYGCDDPGHGHGTLKNSPEERADCYAFQMGLAMNAIVERVSAACPKAIVDFDITEPGRYVGLGFLSVSKYFLFNNGPYYQNYNLPPARDENWNMFFWPGPARGWMARRPLTYDKWIPSTLFMTHYLPDDPRASRLDNFASMILGQNGMWGDLRGLSKEAVEHWGGMAKQYKKVRDDMTEASALVTGQLGGVPEIREKIGPKGQGAVVLFTTTPGTYRYVTAAVPKRKVWENGGVKVGWDRKKRAVLEFTVTAEDVSPGQKKFDGLYDWAWSSTYGNLGGTAKIVFFGV